MTENQRPLVLLHGWGINEKLLQEFCLQYLEGYDTDCPALAAYGSRTDIKASSLNDLCQSIHQSLTSRKEIQLLGWSLGGMVAIRYATLFPSQVKRLLLLCVNPRFTKSTNWSYGIDRVELENMKTGLNQNAREVLKRFYLLSLKNDEAARLKARQMFDRGYTEGLTPEGLACGLDLLQRTNVLADLAQLNCPTTMLYSEDDALVPCDMYQSHVIEHDHVSVCSMSDVGHNPFISTPEQVADIIKSIVVSEYEH